MKKSVFLMKNVNRAFLRLFCELPVSEKKHALSETYLLF